MDRPTPGDAGMTKSLDAYHIVRSLNCIAYELSQLVERVPVPPTYTFTVCPDCTRFEGN